MKMKGLLLITAFCVYAQAADGMSLMQFKATNGCQGCDLKGAEFEGADLRSANLKGADLRYTDLEGADLANADLEGADLGDVRGLDEAKLCKTIMPWGEDNSGCS